MRKMDDEPKTVHLAACQDIQRDFVLDFTLPACSLIVTLDTCSLMVSHKTFLTGHKLARISLLLVSEVLDIVNWRKELYRY